MTHEGSSLCPCFGALGLGVVVLDPDPVCQPARQGVVLSLKSTPWSLASCSRVMGRKDPGHVSYWMKARMGVAYPWHRWQRPLQPSHMNTIPRALSGWWASYPHQHVLPPLRLPSPARRGRPWRSRSNPRMSRSHARRPPPQKGWGRSG